MLGDILIYLFLFFWVSVFSVFFFGLFLMLCEQILYLPIGIFALPFVLISRGLGLLKRQIPLLMPYLGKLFEAVGQIATRLSLTKEEINFLMDFRQQKVVREELAARERLEQQLLEAEQRKEREKRERLAELERLAREEKERNERARRLKREARETLEMLERVKREALQRKEQERREELRKKPRPVKPRRFKDPAVTRLYMMFQDSFPIGGGFTCHGQWVDSELAEKAREVLEPCFAGEPAFKPLSTKIIKLIHADAGDPRLSADERTSMFQLFYEPNVQTRKSTARQEEAICL
jgi:hypothetical protein